jgi:TonB-linked SusC/RagA family outer membrane protein
MSQHLAQWARASLVFVLTAGFAFAQTATITGTVTDADTGEPLPGANVVVSELAGTGTITGADGRYTLPNVPVRAQAYTLRASFTGFGTASQSVLVNQAGQTATANFALRAGVELDAVVVTALGIERQARELGYAVEAVRGDELTAGDNTNLLQALSGRVSGLDITQSSGSIGGSTRIILRGVTSLSGENQPLFVVDGVPISNANVAPVQGRLQGAVDTGNRANDINPADVESITVLKGGAAAALYGQRAKNGVILITTRRGLDRPRAAVQASTSLLTNTVGRLPNFHNEYAPGTAGHYVNTSFTGWGPRIQGQTVTGSIIDQTQENYVLNAHPNNVRDFWQTGVTSTNNVSFSTGTPTTDFRFGVGFINQGGIVPNSQLDRYNVTLNAGTRLANGFSARANVNYITSSDQGRAIQGGNEDTIAGSVFAFPRTLDINDLRNYVDEFGQQRLFGQTGNNPYWIANENLFTSNLNRVFGAGTIGFQAADWLNLTARVGTDFHTQNRRQVYRHGTQGATAGRYRSDIVQQREINTDVFAQFNRPITDEISFQAVVGNNVNQRSFGRASSEAENLALDALWHPANATSFNPDATNSLRRLVGFFGDVTFGWRDAVFLNLTGRNDISSTLPVANRSYFYPSASLSVVFTDLVTLDPNILSYGKLRLSGARVGSDEAPYQLAFRYFPVSSVFGQFNTAVQFPYFGNAAFTSTAVVPPADLRPQQQTTYEIGTELGFLNDRINVDLNLYDMVTDDQIITLPRPFSTGFGGLRTNIGSISNRGIEAVVNAQTFTLGNFSHSFRTTFSTNQNRVVSLHEDVEFITLETGYNTIAVRAEVGESLGLYGTGWQRDPTTGLPLIDPVSGLRLVSNDPVRLGSLDPRFRLGFSNTFRYGPVSLSGLLDWRDGGVLYSLTAASMRSGGRGTETLANRDGTFIDRGVIVTERDTEGNIVATRPNDVPVVSMQDWWAYTFAGSRQESATFDASYVKLRELVLGFDLPQSVLQRSPFGSATIALEGRNLALLYSRIPHIDPETNLFGSGTVGGAGYEFNNLPATRQFGVNISVTF